MKKLYDPYYPIEILFDQIDNKEKLSVTKGEPLSM